MRLLRALGYSIEEAFVELWHNRLVNLVSIGTIAVSLFILGVFLSVSIHLNELIADWASRVQLTLYLADDLPEAHKTRLDDAVAAGEPFTRDNVAALRTGKLERGLAPEALDRVLGRKAARDLGAESPLNEDDLQ